jgi:hypothetical protein
VFDNIHILYSLLYDFRWGVLALLATVCAVRSSAFDAYIRSIAIGPRVTILLASHVLDYVVFPLVWRLDFYSYILESFNVIYFFMLAAGSRSTKNVFSGF